MIYDMTTLGSLGSDQTSAQIVDQATQQYANEPFYSHIQQFVASDLAAGVVDNGGNYAQGDGVCANLGPGPSDLQLAEQSLNAASSIGVSTAIAAGAIAASGPLAPITAAAVGLFDLFANLFGQRHLYTKQQNQILCNAVPIANYTLRQIMAAYQNAQVTANYADQALTSLRNQFASAVSPIINHTAGNYAQTGDNAEFVMASLDALILQAQQFIADSEAMKSISIAATNSAGTTSSSSSSSQPPEPSVGSVAPEWFSQQLIPGLPNWILAGGAGLAVYGMIQ